MVAEERDGADGRAPARDEAGPAMRPLTPDLLVRAYSAGLFPMADSRDAPDIFWVEPRRRGVIPLDEFHLPRSLAKLLRQELFRHTIDRAFDRVIAECAAPGPGREQSWINAAIIDSYRGLARAGQAHSVEVWDADGALAGGLYGVRIGAAFFGESMFSRHRDASKAALAHLVARLRIGGFTLLDTQFITPHLQRLGAIEIRRDAYVALLGPAVAGAGDFGALDRLEPGFGAAVDFDAGAALGAGGPSGKRIAQLLSQTS